MQRRERKNSCKIKRAGESDRTPFIERTEYIIFHDVCLIFHTAIIIYRENGRITIKLHFENLSIFFKSKRTHMLGPPPPVRFCSLFIDPPSPCQQTYFWMTP